MAADKHPDYHPNLPRIFFSKIGNQTLRTAIWTGTDKGSGKRTPLPILLRAAILLPLICPALAALQTRLFPIVRGG